MRPQNIVLSLLNDNVRVIKQDIYNAIAKIRRETRQGISPTQVLISRLKVLQTEGKVVFKFERDDNRHITNLFITNQQSVKYL
jgi:hypothetical protein